MQYPDTYDKQAYLGHFYSAVYRETGEYWSPGAGAARLVEKLIHETVDEIGRDPPYSGCWELAVSLDLAAVNWNYEHHNDLYGKLRASSLLRFTRRQRRSSAYWRGVFFARFAKDEHEYEFFRLWLARMEHAEEEWTPEYDEARKESICRLKEAEDKIRERGNPAAFEFNPFEGLLV